MARSQTFRPLRQPFRDHPALELLTSHVSGPFSFLNPTGAVFRHAAARSAPGKDGASEHDEAVQAHDGEEEEDALLGRDERGASGLHFQWRSRDNRKGRHALVVHPASSDAASPRYITPRLTSAPRAIAEGILRMCVEYPYWDISWLIAVIFTLGSVIWVINGFLVFLPLVRPETEFKNEGLVGGGVTAFIGATVFEVGSVLLMFEAVNEHQEGCFGWAVEKAVHGDHDDEEKFRVEADKAGCAHHHTNEKSLAGHSSIETPAGGSGAMSSAPAFPVRGRMDDTSGSRFTWQWFPSYDDLVNHYVRELGFLASLAQLMGATVFWVSGFTALPGINNKLSQGLLDGIYWAPQIVGGYGFIVSGILFMLETQEAWYRPAFGALGWHVGFWNFVGAVGFTLCGVLGPAYGNSGAEYQASCATFWGSWAFLIGSVIQWYESLDKHPVEEN